MKKYLFIIFLFFTVPFCFSLFQRGNIEFGAGFHHTTENTNIAGIDFTTTIPSFAINFSSISYTTDNMGFGIYANILLPTEVKVTALGGSIILERSHFNLLMGGDALIGPTFILYKNESLSLPLSAGLHIYYLSMATYTTSSIVFQLGLGTNISAVYNFNENSYVFGRFQLSFDFLGLGNDSERFFTLGINPCVGIGFLR
jgi:hypothetical protein